MTSYVAVIVDIVGSRDLPDRPSAQTAISDAFALAHATFAADMPLWATVGDEFQARYLTLHEALGATALVRLLLPADLDCRFGLGGGDAHAVATRADGASIQDGAAWWRAREAIEIGHRAESHGQPWLRTWFVGPDPTAQSGVNALLLMRDHAISRMKARERRLAAGLLQRQPQRELAAGEGITQSAVSQSLQRSGATALAAGLDLFPPKENS